MDNPERRTVYIWLMIAALAAVVFFVPGWLGIDGFDGGFAINFVSLLAFIIALIIALVYNGLANRLDRIFAGEGVLAKWSYTPETWREYTEKEFTMEKAEASTKFYMVAVIALIVGGAFYIFDPEAGGVVFAIMLGLIALIAVVAYTSTRYMHSQNVSGTPEAIIAKNGVYLNHRFYYWDYLRTTLDEIALRDEKGLQMLHFVTWAPSMTLGQIWDIRVPVPPGEEENAKKIVEQLKSK